MDSTPRSPQPQDPPPVPGAEPDADRTGGPSINGARPSGGAYPGRTTGGSGGPADGRRPGGRPSGRTPQEQVRLVRILLIVVALLMLALFAWGMFG